MPFGVVADGSGGPKERCIWIGHHWGHAVPSPREGTFWWGRVLNVGLMYGIGDAASSQITLGFLVTIKAVKKLKHHGRVETEMIT